MLAQTHAKTIKDTKKKEGMRMLAEMLIDA